MTATDLVADIVSTWGEALFIVPTTHDMDAARAVGLRVAVAVHPSTIAAAIFAADPATIVVVDPVDGQAAHYCGALAPNADLMTLRLPETVGSFAAFVGYRGSVGRGIDDPDLRRLEWLRWTEDNAVKAPPTDDTDAPAPTSIGKAWRQMSAGWLGRKPQARDWLIRHPDYDGQPCPPSAGDGLLPRGKVALLTAEGGTGKTLALCQLAVCVVTGRPWMGFHVDLDARKGNVLLALAEEDEAEAHRRLHGVCTAMRLDDAERAAVEEQVRVLPLAGADVALLAESGFGVVSETPVLTDLRHRLAVAGPWSLVALDPIARFAGLSIDGDTVAATRLVQALETLVDVAGKPTVLGCVHSSKAARREGKVDVRGATALTDGVRWVGALSRDKGRVMFQQSKSNYSRPMAEPVPLQIVRDTLGMILVPAAIDAPPELPAGAGIDEAVAALQRIGGRAGSKDSIAAAIGGRMTEARAKVGDAIALRRIVRDGTTRDPIYMLPTDPACARETPPDPPTGRRDVVPPRRSVTTSSSGTEDARDDVGRGRREQGDLP